MLSQNEYLVRKQEYLNQMNEYLQKIANLPLDDITNKSADYVFSKIQYQTLQSFVDFNKYIGDIRRKAEGEYKLMSFV